MMTNDYPTDGPAWQFAKIQAPDSVDHSYRDKLGRRARKCWGPTNSLS